MPAGFARGSLFEGAAARSAAEGVIQVQTPSVIAARCHLPHGGRLWHGGKVSVQTAMPAGFARGSPFEERLPPRRGKMSRSDKRGNLDAKRPERARTLPVSPLSFYQSPRPCSTWNNFTVRRPRWECAPYTRYTRPSLPGGQWRAHRCRSSDGWHGRWCSQKCAHP